MINNLTIFEKAIILVSKNKFSKYGNKYELIRKLLGWHYGLNVEHIDDYIELRNIRRIYFKLHPDENVLDRIEKIESEISFKFGFIGYEDKNTLKQISDLYLSYIAFTQVFDNVNDDNNRVVLIVLSLKLSERREIIKVLKVKTLSDLYV